MLRLRPYKPNDAERIASWITDENTYYMWSMGKFGEYPITASDINDVYMTYENNELFYMMTAIEDSEVVGHMVMRFVDGMDTVRFGFIIVDGSKRGMGYGKSMLKLAKTYAFDILKAKRVTLGVFKDNVRAYNCYLSAGFCRDDRLALSRVSIQGTDYDIIEMEALK